MKRRRQVDRAKRASTLEEIAARKRELAEHAADQRRTLAHCTAGLSPAFAAADKVVGVGRSLLSRPYLLVGAAGLLVVLWPRGAFAVATRGVALWSGVRAARRLLTARG